MRGTRSSVLAMPLRTHPAANQPTMRIATALEKLST